MTERSESHRWPVAGADAVRGSTVLVIGLGASGIAAARLLRDLGAHVRAYDQRAEAPPGLDGVKLHLGSPMPPDEAFSGLHAMVLSPGVPPAAFRERCRGLAPHAAVEGELGLALRLIPEPRPRTVLITGTNGKSTVTALTGALLRAAGRQPFVGGNLGEPSSTCVRASLVDGEPWPTDLVLECSSYQLETIPTLPTAVAMVLNVTPDHLDRYPSMEAYAQTKARVFDGLGSGDLALLDADDSWTERIAPSRQGVIVARIGDPTTATVLGDGSGRELSVGTDPPYPRELLRLPARHNARNALFALVAARHLGVTVQQCRQGLAAFEGLPHRMRLVRELDGVRFYNDSKATNIASAVAGLSGLDERFVLIAGGLGKGDDLEPLRELLAARARGLVAIGKSADDFLALADGIPAVRAQDMQGAVSSARAIAHRGDAVVLAPACASFDMYRSYAERGEVFEAEVSGLETMK